MQMPLETMTQYNVAQTMPLIDPKLYPKKERIKLKAIKNLDIEKIIENTDVLALENFLPNIINGKLSKEEYQRTDKKTLAKLLQIFQLSLEYFSYTHNYLTSLKEKLHDENIEIESQLKDEKECLKKQHQEYKTLKEKVQVKQKALQTYKKFVEANPIYRCHLCVNKYFQNEQFLDAHMKRRHPKQSIQETSHEINNNNNDNKSNEIINNLINALTQTAIHRTEKEDKGKDDKLLQEIYQKFISNEEKWEERLKAIEETQKLKNELVSPNLKSHAFSRSPSKKNSISQASNSDDDEEQIDENESQIKQNIVPEKANSQMISPSPAKNNSFGFFRNEETPQIHPETKSLENEETNSEMNFELIEAEKQFLYTKSQISQKKQAAVSIFTSTNINLEMRKKNEEMEKEIKKKFKDTLTFEYDELNNKSIDQLDKILNNLKARNEHHERKFFPLKNDKSNIGNKSFNQLVNIQESKKEKKTSKIFSDRELTIDIKKNKIHNNFQAKETERQEIFNSNDSKIQPVQLTEEASYNNMKGNPHGPIKIEEDFEFSSDRVNLMSNKGVDIFGTGRTLKNY